MAESNTFTGSISSIRTTYQTLTSTDLFSKDVQFACFTKNPFMKVLGLEAFGVEAVTNVDSFISARPSGRLLRYDSGHYGIRGAVWETAGHSQHAGRLTAMNPELVEGGDEWAYSWHRLFTTQFIPDVDIQDNGNGNFDIKALKMSLMKQTFVRDINYCWLGNSSAPDASTLGPSAVYSDLPNLISVTQSRTVGGISKSGNTYWNNGTKSITDPGGGGEMDRPIALRRGLMDAMNDQLTLSEASKDYLLLATQGAWQYYDRIMYADAVQSGAGGAFGTLQKYDAAGIQHKAFEGQPLVWDPAVTVPYGASASTECIYGIHIPTFFISIRSEENFKASDWEEPREHDPYKALVASIKLRSTPMVTAMRPQWVVYDMVACPD